MLLFAVRAGGSIQPRVLTSDCDCAAPGLVVWVAEGQGGVGAAVGAVAAEEGDGEVCNHIRVPRQDVLFPPHITEYLFCDRFCVSVQIFLYLVSHGIYVL